MVTRIVVGAHYGLKDWLGQRITAVVMAVYTLIFAVGVLFMGELNYDNWRGLFAGGFMRFATFLFFASLMYHAWVGVRDIYMDYIKPTGIRLVLQVATVVALIGYAIWAVIILWRV